MPSPGKTGATILAIDHGTSGVKAALVSANGNILDFESRKTPIQYLPGGGAEQDPADWWDALCESARSLVERNRQAADTVEAVCCSSTFSSTVAVDSRGENLGNALTWMDCRGAPYIRDIMEGFPAIQGYGLGSVLPWIYKTGGGPQLSGKDDIAHVLYWKNERPELYREADKFLGSKDYLNLKLTGRSAASFDSIMLFWVTNTRDPKSIHYDDKLIRKLGIDRAKLPPLTSSIDVLGTLLPEVACAMGLKKDVKVVVGSPDHQSACMGSGAVRDFEGHVYIGTSSWIQCIVPFRKTDVAHSIASLPTSIPGKYYCANEQDIAGGCLPWLVDNVLFHKNRLGLGDPPEKVFELMDEIAAGVEPGSNGLIFTPWLNGERTPVDDTTVRAGLHNMSMTTTAEHIIRAFFEGVAFNNRWALKHVEKFIGRKMETLNMVGGGARSGVWCRIFADVLKRTTRQVKDPMLANARGAAFIASVALGHITFDDIPGLIEYENVYKPDPENAKLYDELFEEFLAIYKNNRAMYKRLNRNGS